MPLLKTKTQQQKTEAPKEEVKKKTGGDAFAQKANATDASDKGTFIPPDPGTYNALITEVVGQEEDPQSIYIEYTIAGEGAEDMEGKNIRQYFNFTDEDGKDKSAMPFFKQVLAMLGYDEAIESFNQILEWLVDEHAKNETWVVIDVKKKGKYTNVFLSSVPENQKGKPENPNS